MFDIYAAVTSRILDQLEQGSIPWRKPWTGSPELAVSHTKLRPYSLVNQLLLGEPGEFLTLKQCNEEGGRVKKGAKSRMVVFWKLFQRPHLDNGAQAFDADGRPVFDNFPVLRYYRVFSVSDCDGITPRRPSAATLPHIDPDQRAEAIFADYRSREHLAGFSTSLSDRAFYRPATDEICLPLRDQFTSSQEYYSTLFHEAVHSTGHKTRLDRFGNGAAAFGSATYSREELVAEIGAAAILHSLGIETPETFANSSAYIGGWSESLRKDPKLFISATSRAEKAVRMILGTSADAPEAFEATEQ